MRTATSTISYLLIFGLTLSTAASAWPNDCSDPVSDHSAPRKDRSVVRTSELRIPSDPNIEIFITRVQPKGAIRGAVILTHGAGSPSSAVWHLPFGYSILEALAKRGFDTYAVDMRGFGGSTRPASMQSDAPDAPAAIRASEVMPDIQAAVALAQANSGHRRVDLVAWSWGCVVAGMYASTHPSTVRRMVLYAPVFDRQWPTRHKTQPASRIEKRPLHMKWLDPQKESPKVREAFVERLFRFEPKPNELRLPNGPYRDIYGPDAPIWDPSKVTAATLILRGSKDLASLRPHALSLYEALTHAQQRQYLEIDSMGHFAFRTFNNPLLVSSVVNFLVTSFGEK